MYIIIEMLYCYYWDIV